MRHGRAKAARKTLQYFGRTIGLKSPYSILLDATFVAAIFQQKILPLKPRLDRVLQTPPTIHNKYFITKEAVDELRQILEGLEKRKHTKAIAFREALEWVSKECILLPSTTTTVVPAEENSEEAPTKKRKQSSLSTPAQEALLHTLEENETPYIVASQDEELLTILRQKGGVPIVRLANHTVLLLEQPSKQTQFQAKGSEQQKWRHNLPEAEKALVDLAKKATKETIHGIDEGQQQEKQQQQSYLPTIKKSKGPNPLSCKRKEQPTNNKPKESSSKKRRKRAHKNASSNEESH